MMSWTDPRYERPKSGKRLIAGAAGTMVLAVALGVAFRATAQDTKSPYPSMAPLDQYLIADQSAEVALARSAAPDSISGQAEVRVLTRHGYETMAEGTNGFVCVVERSWTLTLATLIFGIPSCVRRSALMQRLRGRSSRAPSAEPN